jgi:hypothetical protein
VLKLNIESIQTGFDGDKWKEWEFCSTLCQHIEMEDNFLNRSVTRKQNPTLILGHFANLKSPNYFVPWASSINGSWQRVRKVDSTITFVTYVIPQVLGWQALETFSRNFIFRTYFRFWMNWTKLRDPQCKAYIWYILSSRSCLFSQCSLYYFSRMSWIRWKSRQQKLQQSRNMLWSLPFHDVLTFYDYSIVAIPVYNMSVFP